MKEKISTLLDDELDLKGTGQAVSEIAKDQRLRERFETYQLIRDSMKNELSDATFSSKSILDAIDKEPIQMQFNHSSKVAQAMVLPYPAWMSWQVAASFAAVLLIAALSMNNSYLKPSETFEIAEDIPVEYIQAHQISAPTNVAYYSETGTR
jgi:sigma-E factor negative regulatory protein RseA